MTLGLSLLVLLCKDSIALKHRTHYKLFPQRTLPSCRIHPLPSSHHSNPAGRQCIPGIPEFRKAMGTVLRSIPAGCSTYSICPGFGTQRSCTISCQPHLDGVLGLQLLIQPV